jgi:hypothetical protein
MRPSRGAKGAPNAHHIAFALDQDGAADRQARGRPAEGVPLEPVCVLTGPGDGRVIDCSGGSSLPALAVGRRSADPRRAGGRSRLARSPGSTRPFSLGHAPCAASRHRAGALPEGIAGMELASPACPPLCTKIPDPDRRARSASARLGLAARWWQLSVTAAKFEENICVRIRSNDPR